MRNWLIASAILLFACPAFAATPQQERMKACNADAAKQELKGDARKQFMKSCLSSKKEAKEESKAAAGEQPKAVSENKARTAQQQKMKRCNADAKAKSLSGQARKDFMKTCLTGN